MSMSYREALELTAEIYGTNILNIEQALTNAGADYTVENLQRLWPSQSISGSTTNIVRTASGKTLFYTADTAASISSNPIDSNTSLQGAMKVPVNTTVADVPPTPTSTVTFKGGMREAGKFALNEVVPAVAAASVGISLGKTIDNALYNFAPDFWDSVGMGAMDPDTWNDIISLDGGGNPLFNMVFGIDPDTGETQAYLEDTAAAYLAMYMNEKGVFANGTEIPSAPSWTVGQTITDVQTVSISQTVSSIANYTNTLNRAISEVNRLRIELGYNDDDYIQFQTISTNNYVIGYFIHKENFIGKTITGVRSSFGHYMYDGTYSGGHRFVARERGTSNYDTNGSVLMTGFYENTHSLFGNIPISNVGIKVQPQGIDNQDGAVVPTGTNNWTDIDSTKQSLQNQYPDLWNNAKHYDVVNDDGTTTSRTFIPVNVPKATSKNDTKPTSGNQKQSEPQTDPQSDPDIQDLITQLITQLTTPTNPPDTGSGDTPVVPAPTGSASSLWAVYNPTQAQVDAFGSWLWSSNLVEQIKKLFNDPMQAIIGIHKVFATPATGPAQNIKCGYIDSGVPSAVVTSQYTTIDCGTVNLREQFGNVFDYSPFTEVSLYLPFIGIVKLDVGDVMRSSIKVKYHVDVITGACLADVIVNRDASGGVLYQYSGSAIVTYPLSSGSYASALAGVVSIAGGIAATVATGGAAAPALLGAAVGVSHLHSDVQKSGSFSGAAGAMGGKKPYLIISRPQTAMPSSYKHLEGQPTNHYTTLSNCSGYVKVKQVQVKGLNATDAEMDLIKELLLQGVEM